jgi:hypothetical protein
VVLAANWRAVPRLLARVVLPYELVASVRQMLWNARTSSPSRTMMIEVFAAAISFVKKLPVRASCSTRPTWSHARRKIASRSSS